MIQQLGQTYEEKGDVQAALEQYQRYAQRYPDEVDGQRRIGRLHARTGRHAEARRAYEKALVLEPEDVPTLVALAALETKLGNADAALQQLRQAEETATTPQEKISVLSGRVNVYDYTGQMRKAVAVFEELVREAAKVQPPQSVLTIRMQATGQQAEADLAHAEAELAALRKQLTPPWDMFLPLAEIPIADVQGDAARLERAADDLDQMIRKTTMNVLRANLLDARARARELRGDCAGAIKLFEDVRKLVPLDISPLHDIGRCQRKLGRKADAEKTLREVLRIEPAHARANHELALLYKAAGDPARATQHADRARATWQNADPGYRFLKELAAL
jgi:tetratricopeptide (TPR) repeat protein